MTAPCCDWCGAPADVIDNYDTYRCWECWDDGARDLPHNLVISVLHQRGSTVGDAGGGDDER